MNISRKTIELAIQAIRNDRHERGRDMTMITRKDGSKDISYTKNYYYEQCELAIHELESALKKWTRSNNERIVKEPR